MILEAKPPKTIPRHLIYEMDEGVPIYYKWYKDALYNNYQNYDEIMPDSRLQAWLKGYLTAFLTPLFNLKIYTLTCGEQGLQLKKKNWRGADIAIFRKKNFVLDDKYADLPPEVVIEINIKGYYETDEQAYQYFERKNTQLLTFGVKKIIWIFTEAKAVLVITPQGRQEFDWNQDVEVLEGIHFNVQTLIDQFNQE